MEIDKIRVWQIIRASNRMVPGPTPLRSKASLKILREVHRGVAAQQSRSQSDLGDSHREGVPDRLQVGQVPSDARPFASARAR